MHRSALCLVVLAACGTPKGPPQPYVQAVGEVKGKGQDQGQGAGPDQGLATNELTVEVSNLRSDAGTVRCFLYDGPEGFPDNAAHLIAKAVALPAARAATCRFTGLGADHDYAIVTLHDEDNDGVFKKGAFGIPEEGLRLLPRRAAPVLGAVVRRLQDPLRQRPAVDDDQDGLLIWKLSVSTRAG